MGTYTWAVSYDCESPRVLLNSLTNLYSTPLENSPRLPATTPTKMKGRANNRLALRPKSAFPTPQASRFTTPASSAVTSAVNSAYPSEAEDEDATSKTKPFPFLSLPSELRNKIYYMVFSVAPAVIDLDPSTHRIYHRTQLFALFRVPSRFTAKPSTISSVHIPSVSSLPTQANTSRPRDHYLRVCRHTLVSLSHRCSCALVPVGITRLKDRLSMMRWG